MSHLFSLHSKWACGLVHVFALECVDKFTCVEKLKCLSNTRPNARVINNMQELHILPNATGCLTDVYYTRLMVVLTSHINNRPWTQFFQREVNR